MTAHRARARSVIVAPLLAVSCATPPPTVQLTMDVEREGARVNISGTTDLADGALLAYELRHEHLAYDPETPRDMLFLEGVTTVSDGRFEAEVDLSSFEPGAIEVWVSFQMRFINSDRTQPSPIVRQFGARGELLEGTNVSAHDDGKRVELSQTIHW
ncbi:MAG: hypothetical protein QF463_09460 [Vicinamibacterales bacterium]|nr:hypothetical protein [Vicinamibacterales bacterium]MDP6609281.1 hypothetical protein [Vicinamibacterales bacterium]